VKKTILITGGAGFIGSNFVHHIWRRYPDYKILVLDLLTYAGNPENFPVQGTGNPRFEFWYGNVCNAELVDALVARSDYVVHFAAESHVTRSIYDNHTFFRTDVMGTHAIANAVLKYRNRVKRLVHISTSEVYGTAETQLMNEEHPLKPLSPYASAKCGADRLVFSYHTTYKIPVVIVRPFNNYGPRQHLEKLVPRFLTSVLLKEPLTVHGDGSAARDFIYVEDNCEAIDLLLHAPQEKVDGEIFNVGTGIHRSISQIARDIRKIHNKEFAGEIIVADRPGQVFRHTADIGKIKKVFGWKPKTSWEDGLARTFDWYEKNRSWWEKQIWMRHIPIEVANGAKVMH
jgi:dTDP-glucose 4,6-dehydratase